MKALVHERHKETKEDEKAELIWRLRDKWTKLFRRKLKMQTLPQITSTIQTEIEDVDLALAITSTTTNQTKNIPRGNFDRGI